VRCSWHKGLERRSVCRFTIEDGLNDSTGPDGAQEWAVCRKSDGQQLESITVGWATPEDDKKNILEVQRQYRNGDGRPMWSRDYTLGPNALDHPEGTCHHCA